MATGRLRLSKNRTLRTAPAFRMTREALGRPPSATLGRTFPECFPIQPGEAADVPEPKS